MSITIETLIKPSEYHDSVSLMLVARALADTDGILDAAVVMGTEANKSILADADLLTETAQAASANDLVIAVRADRPELAAAGLALAEALLKKKAAAVETGEYQPKSIHAAKASHPELNVAVISVAGRYAADEAWDALTRGMHVLLFSDNVSLEDEIALKQYASDHGLLLMGPGAGTTILNNIALGFANVLPAGPVGIVSAAGTGLQEVSTLLARLGVGITQGLGVGGRDLSDAVGGIMMLDGLRALQADPATEVIALISKPPSPGVTKKILAQVAVGGKPTVICFLGGDVTDLEGEAAVIPAATLEEAALLTAQATGADLTQIGDLQEHSDQDLRDLSAELRAALGPGPAGDPGTIFGRNAVLRSPGDLERYACSASVFQCTFTWWFDPGRLDEKPGTFRNRSGGGRVYRWQAAPDDRQ